MGYSDLIKSISDQFKGAFQSFKTDKPVQRYPSSLNTVTNQPVYDDGTWKSSKGYSFRVVVVDGNTVKDTAAGWQEFNLQINPQELAQDEIFAIQVTPTLRGILVEHQGSTLKDITISGTTGLSPMRREGGAKKNTGRPVLASGHSGFEEFHELRSYFRAYVEAKRKDSAGNLRMIFFNKRDAEQLLVEPQKFTMKRSAAKPFLYEYSIQLKAIAVANGDKIPSANAALEGILGKIQSIDKAFDYLTEAQQTIEGAIGLIRRTERDIEATVLGPLRTINAMLRSIRGGAAALFGPFGVTRRFVQSLELECKRIEANLNDLLAKPLGDFNRVTGRVSTLQGPVGRQPTYQELKTLNAFNSVKKATILLLAEISFYENDTNQASASATAQYQQRTVNSEGQIVQIPNSNFSLAIPASVTTAPIDGNDTIHTIAAKALGDPDRFKEIVILNGLKPPYISATGGNGTLKPGDLILIPSSGGTDSVAGIKQNAEYEVTKGFVHAEKSLGVDLRVDEDFDLVFANFGDYDLVAGIQNMAQAIVIRMGLDKGSLKRHPSIGAGLQTGAKTKDVQEIREDLVRSLQADSRVESIPFASVEQQGGTTIINMVIKIKNVGQPVPVSINV